MEKPDFTGMPNLEYLNLSLKEVHPSLGCSRKLISLKLYGCINLERFPCLNVGLEKFPEFLGRLKPKLDISVRGSKIRSGLPRVLDLRNFKNLVAFPSSIGMLKMYLFYTQISQLPSSIIWLNKLKSLSFAKENIGGGLF
ncbi:hypothetical protein RDI58_001475 [Solanum bulbocastanum]|uniref:Uncharacterized protein n=1 Tax=Solanum bulbocastanum TaxID=147425 RepID=A0AAN8UEF1_SOLBU